MIDSTRTTTLRQAEYAERGVIIQHSCEVFKNYRATPPGTRHHASPKDKDVVEAFPSSIKVFRHAQQQR